MFRFLIIGVLVITLQACQPAEETQKRSDTAAATPAATPTPTPTSTPVRLPSQDAQTTKGFKMPANRPAEVCMEKGFTWLYQGYLKPECGTCHFKDNQYAVTQFAQADIAASFTVVKTQTNSAKLLSAVLGNVFCKSCVIARDDPLYADLEYFTTHMDSCEKP